MKKKTAIILLIIGILLVGGIYFQGQRIAKSKIKEVKTATVSRGDIKSYLSTTAVIKSKESKDYYSAQLKINKLYVKVGSNLKKGDKILDYDITDINAQVRQAQIQYDNAILQKRDAVNQREMVESKRKDIEVEIERLEESKNPQDQITLGTLKQQRDSFKSISDEQLQLLDNSVALAKTALNTSYSKLSIASEGIIADFDGVITSLNVSQGSMGNPTQPASTLQNIKSLKAVVSLGKYDVLKVKLGQGAIIKNGDKIYNGKVSFISPSASKGQNVMGVGVVDTVDKTLDCDIDIIGNPQDLKIDFDADVDILLGEVKGVLKIPTEAIRTDKSGKNFVYAVENGVLSEKEVGLGLQSDMEAEIKSGLAQGEKVVLNPSGNFKTGTKVRVV
ncbi:HlyD family secretion protein [Clostridium pascui]|uniref:efflux RND transporter periplasmic adaptor subunit n=1 Tax=Clostridium pascui TaxID=46609 RepID=UPI00195C6BCB|nr:HlyD family efflux transporter periplasmic adaptor subunit [Clostridium pascui]MBM7871172.1 HlyD family secretion protein [Clostridium pascui]